MGILNKKMMHKLAGLALLSVIAVVSAENSPTCMYCKKQDSDSSFLYSYSYCKDTNECLADEWNYMNKWCKTKWISGWMLDIDVDCEAKEAIGQCVNFVPTPGFEKKEMAVSTLQAGQKCTVSVDANQALGRVIFTSAVNLGFLWNGYVPTDPITIPMGNVQEITVYNGNKSGNIAFTQVFTGAKTLSLAASTLALGSIMALY